MHITHQLKSGHTRLFTNAINREGKRLRFHTTMRILRGGGPAMHARPG